MYSLYIRISMNPIDWFDSPLGADAEQKKKKKSLAKKIYTGFKDAMQVESG